MSLPDLLDLACPIQRMGFGPCGHDSLAYRLFLQGHHDTVFGLSSDDGNTPFAELWMGATHEKGVSKVRKPAELAGRDLSSVLLDDEGEHFLGPKLLKKFPKMAKRVHAGVPFVFKVLSAGKALPLQVHPDEKLSEQLRNKGKTESEDISVVDSMHKPEIALALTPFEAFIGFAPRAEIISRLRSLSEVRDVGQQHSGFEDDLFPNEENIYDYALSSDSPGKWKDIMSTLTCRLLLTDSSQLKSVTESVLDRHRGAPNADVESTVKLIERLYAQHPDGDSGVLYAPLFMNHVSLKPGECIYAPANTVHSWLSGSIIECMPSSANVINGGFGPKPSADVVRLFTETLTYEDKPVQDFLLPPKPHNAAGLRYYEVPEEEFSILGIQLGCNESSMISNQPLEGIAVFVCLDGSGHVKAHRNGGITSSTDEQSLQPGTVTLVASGVTLTFVSNEHSSLSGYLAFCHLAE